MTKKSMRPALTGQQTKNYKCNDAYRGNKTVYDRILNTLDRRCYKDGKKMISFPDVYLCLSWMQISKKDSHIILYEMQKLGLIEIKRYHGIIIRGKV